MVFLHLPLYFGDPQPDFLESNTIWVASLNTGDIVYPQVKYNNEILNNTWANLRKFIVDSCFHITNLELRFRDNILRMIPNADGYYLAQGVIAGLGCGVEHKTMTIGVFDKAKSLLYYNKVVTPELIVIDSGSKNISVDHPALIVNVK